MTPLVTQFLYRRFPGLFWKLNSSWLVETIRRKQRDKKNITRGKEAIAKLDVTPEEKERLLRDFLKASVKYTLSWGEYYHYFKFPGLPEEERAKFISDLEASRLTRKFNTFDRPFFNEKTLFLKTFSKYVCRDWLLATSETPEEEIEAFLAGHDVIAKPAAGTYGNGVIHIGKQSKGALRLDSLPDAYRSARVLYEERIVGAPEIEEFHPASLNTLRLITVQNKGKAELLAAELRVGNHGNPADNAHFGGIAAHIDKTTGRLDSGGVDRDGQRYDAHPMTGKVFQGFQIPKWDEVVAMCLEATSVVPRIHLVGWDVAVRADGKIEFVEGNPQPGVSAMQGSALRGLRAELLDTLHRLEVLK